MCFVLFCFVLLSAPLLAARHSACEAAFGASTALNDYAKGLHAKSGSTEAFEELPSPSCKAVTPSGVEVEDQITCGSIPFTTLEGAYKTLAAASQECKQDR